MGTVQCSLPVPSLLPPLLDQGAGLPFMKATHCICVSEQDLHQSCMVSYRSGAPHSAPTKPKPSAFCLAQRAPEIDFLLLEICEGLHVSTLQETIQC